MSKIEAYRRAAAHCVSNAENSPFEEIRAIWLTMKKSYDFLIDLESRSRRPMERVAAGDRSGSDDVHASLSRRSYSALISR
jgi:hypothetical protein